MLDFHSESIHSLAKGRHMPDNLDHSHIDFFICDTCPNQPLCKTGRACRYYSGWLNKTRPDINVDQMMRRPEEIPGLSNRDRKFARTLFLPKVEIFNEIYSESD